MVTVAQRVSATAPAFAVDRYLCSYSHLAPGFARYVLGEFTGPRTRAIDPAFGVDLIALVRHATLAEQRITRLNRVLAADLALLLLLVLLAASGAGVGALGALVGIACLVAAPLAVLLHALAVHRQLLRIDKSAGRVRDLAPPVKAEVEQRLAELMDGNVIVFGGGDPFTGYGLKLPHWSIGVDATRPAKDSAGNPRQVLPFTAADLLKELTQKIRKSGIAGLRVHNRLFVSGGATELVPGLLPDPIGPPAPRVSTAAIRQGIDSPNPDARTYLCVEKVSWSGELVVNLLVRAEVHAGDLFVEGHAFVLLPIRPEMCPVDLLTRGRREGLVWAVDQTVRCTLRWFLGSPLNLVKPRLRQLKRAQAVAADQRRVRRGGRLDRSSSVGVRSIAADRERVYLFAYVDEEMILNSLRRRVLDGIENFLERHGVDTTQFTKDQSNIVNNNYSIQNALANAMTIGTNNTLTNTTAAGQTGQPGVGTGPASTPLPWSSSP